MGNQSQLLLQPTEVKLGLQVGVEFDKIECLAMPKLRTFNLFKDFETQPCFLTKPLNFFQRRAIASLRIGSFRLRIETQRYFRPKVPYERRYCIACPNHNLEIECEIHYLFSCTAYSDL